MFYRSGIGGRTTGLPSVSTVASGGDAGCGGTYGAAAAGNGGGAYCAAENVDRGLRAGGAAARGGAAFLGAAIRGGGLGREALVSEAFTSEALASDALAMSRDICS